MKRIAFALAVCFALSASFSAPAEEAETLRLVHPYTAMARSAVVPGWGQLAVGEPFQGAFFAVSTIGLAGGWWLSRAQFQDIYNNDYLPAIVDHGLTSPEAEAVYDRANERYKISQFFLFAGLGVWAYGLIDAYIDANIHNAEARGKRVHRQSESMRDFTFFSVEEGAGGIFRFRF